MVDYQRAAIDLVDDITRNTNTYGSKNTDEKFGLILREYIVNYNKIEIKKIVADHPWLKFEVSFERVNREIMCFYPGLADVWFDNEQNVQPIQSGLGRMPDRNCRVCGRRSRLRLAR